MYRYRCLKANLPRSKEDWALIAETFLSELGMPPDTPYAVYRHHDTECDHIHIIANRVSLSGKVFLGQKDVKKAIRITQELEKRFGLTLTKGLDKERTNTNMNEIKMAERTQQLSNKQRIRIYIDASISKAASFEDFVLILEDFGVKTSFNTASNGRVSGVSFMLDGFVVKGSKLGSRYSYNALRKKLPFITIMQEQERNMNPRERIRTR